MKPAEVMVCFGTRPEVIKLAPVIARLQADSRLDVTTVTTGQHREMLEQMLHTFAIAPDVDLGLMRARQGVAALTVRAVAALEAIMVERQPDAVLVQGDTTTAFSAALAAFYARVPVGHVEAGLRTGDRYAPFPEEMNRRLVTPLASWHFCPTAVSADNLAREGVSPASVEVTGNTVVDSLQLVLRLLSDGSACAAVPPRRARHRVLVTLHRRETQGEPQRRLCRMLARVASRGDVEVVFPIHLSPAVHSSVRGELRGLDNVHLLPPVDYVSFVELMRTSDLVLTDSGGVQEEAPSLGVPVLVMRDATDRPEGVSAGCAVLAGTDPGRVSFHVNRMLDDPVALRRAAGVQNPYGDGRAAERIVDSLARDLDGRSERRTGRFRRREDAAPVWEQEIPA
ncbi:MAG TPA: UDP-N-acetylglucosamine 2-epimerase (non-hydrolyzing) [Thermoleophilaceae bacterium]|nr:UDP-N-acetylglucosamine 2-epimerase (non-hydrolyzing) [Thermoleophilaceae bacterium]